jgi:hypothetical protein
MSDITDDGVVVEEAPKIPTDVPSPEDEVKSPSDQETSDNDEHLSRRKKKESERKNEIAQLQKRLDELEGVKEAVQPFLQEQSFKKAIREMGVSAKEIDREAFEKEFETLKADGLTTDKATKTALRLIGARIKDAEDFERASGRTRATLPPTSTKTAEKTVYTEKEIENLSQSEYTRVMNMRDKGEITIR